MGGNKVNSCNVPFLSGKRKVTDEYRKNYDQIDWSSKRKKSSKEDDESSEDTRKEKSNG